MRKIISLALSVMVVGALAASASAAPVKVFTDAVGDADVATGAGSSIPLGLDLESGTIDQKGKNLIFSVAHADMPPMGSLPEAARFLWNFHVDGKPFRLTVKRADVGKPDVVGGQTTERVGRVDVNGHFRLEGECVTDASLPLQRVNCPPLAYLEGTWDPDSKSFSMTVPLKAIKAKKGSVISSGSENICIICWVSHVGERSLNSTIIDATAQAVSYKVR